MERWCNGNGWCTQLEKLDILIFVSFLQDYCRAICSVMSKLRVQAHLQKFGIVVNSGEIPDNSSTEVSTTLFPTEWSMILTEYNNISLTDFFLQKIKFFDLQKNFMFHNSWDLIISNQPLQKIYRVKFAAQTFLGKFGEIRAKYPSHPKILPAVTPMYPLMGFLTGLVLVCT